MKKTSIKDSATETTSIKHTSIKCISIKHTSIKYTSVKDFKANFATQTFYVYTQAHVPWFGSIIDANQNIQPETSIKVKGK